MSTSPVIDVHTHMLTHAWFDLLKQHGGPRYTTKEVQPGLHAIHLDGAPFMTPVPPMFDYDLRIKKMDQAGIDIAVMSLSCPNVYWGGEAIGLEAARIMNDSMADAQTAYPDRIRFMASMPWEYPQTAIAELERARSRGAVGVMVLANINGKPLTDPLFEPIWKRIDELGLPVLVHPTAPPGVAEMGMHEFQLTASIGFTFDTTLAVGRMMLDGFFERFQRVKIIAAHGGGALPYLVGRLDQCWYEIPATRAKTDHRPSYFMRPSDAMRMIYCDAVVFRQDALEMAVGAFGADRVMYGSDYPHTIGDMFGCLARVDRLAGSTRDKVRGTTARQIFGL
ncbi:amidohydrolase family protein [Rhodoplanes sp.]|uniref:amidohydrolase family protein n=1 Tax=Rhodoplanes sp. TaxID=1968906 RepID=UPI0025D075B3|nr:amidohydrolase family protein [Rhodoplanes sp.]